MFRGKEYTLYVGKQRAVGSATLPELVPANSSNISGNNKLSTGAGSTNSNNSVVTEKTMSDSGLDSTVEFRPNSEDNGRRAEQVKMSNLGASKDGKSSGYDESEVSDDESSCCGFVLVVISYLFVLVTFPFSLLLCIKVVQEYERAVIFRLGRIVKGGARGPGLFFVLPCLDNYTKIDLRTIAFDVPPQEVLTKDSVTVAVDAVVYYRIHNATVSVTNVEDCNRSTRLLAATTLRNVLGTKSLSDLLADREHIAEIMKSTLDEATENWGVRVERVEIKDVRLPVQLQRAMAAEAEAAREARAKVIAAEGEQNASVALREAAIVLSESPAALQLRYLQTLNSISAEKNSTIIFPLPIDLIQAFMSHQPPTNVLLVPPKDQ